MRKVNTLLIAGAFIVGLGFNTFAMSDTSSKIAVVDVNRVVSNSSQIMALKKEQNLKTEEIQKWITIARSDIEKQKTQEEKVKLAKKYDSDFQKKQLAIQKDYTDKLQVIDKDISNIIAKTAKEKGYDIVLTKGVVLYGGDDITNTISKLIK